MRSHLAIMPWHSVSSHRLITMSLWGIWFNFISYKKSCEACRDEELSHVCNPWCHKQLYMFPVMTSVLLPLTWWTWWIGTQQFSMLSLILKDRKQKTLHFPDFPEGSLQTMVYIWPIRLFLWILEGGRRLHFCCFWVPAGRQSMGH